MMRLSNRIAATALAAVMAVSMPVSYTHLKEKLKIIKSLDFSIKTWYIHYTKQCFERTLHRSMTCKERCLP